MKKSKTIDTKYTLTLLLGVFLYNSIPKFPH